MTEAEALARLTAAGASGVMDVEVTAGDWREFDVPDCPPSGVHDMFVHWTNSDGSLNVQPGDLIVWVNDFRLVLTIEPHHGGDGVMVLLDGGMPWPTYCRGDGLVAVRRYDTGKGLTDG